MKREIRLAVSPQQLTVLKRLLEHESEQLGSTVASKPHPSHSSLQNLRDQLENEIIRLQQNPVLD